MDLSVALNATDRVVKCLISSSKPCGDNVFVLGEESQILLSVRNWSRSQIVQTSIKCNTSSEMFCILRITNNV